MITKAVIPCGGRGTRMLSLTRGAPKELVPVAGVPLILRVLAECKASSIDEVLVVISPEKTQIETVVREAGRDMLPSTVQFAVQKEPRGLADAIRIGRDFAASSPIAVALPDNLFIGDAPGVRQVVDMFEKTAMNVVAMVEITSHEASRRGPTAIYAGRVRGDEFVIDRIPDKGARGLRFDTGGAESAFTGVGRYVFDNDAFRGIDEVESSLVEGAELDDVPVLQLLLSRGRLIGRRMHGKFLDVGLPEGHREADALLTAR